jgi:hypothetical protein
MTARIRSSASATQAQPFAHAVPVAAQSSLCPVAVDRTENRHLDRTGEIIVGRLR